MEPQDSKERVSAEIAEFKYAYLVFEELYERHNNSQSNICPCSHCNTYLQLKLTVESILK